jgi:hypothetical protein
MKDIDYKYRANSKEEFNYQYQQMLNDGFEINAREFDRLKKELHKFTDKKKWMNDIYMYIQ